MIGVADLLPDTSPEDVAEERTRASKDSAAPVARLPVARRPGLRARTLERVLHETPSWQRARPEVADAREAMPLGYSRVRRWPDRQQKHRRHPAASPSPLSGRSNDPPRLRTGAPEPDRGNVRAPASWIACGSPWLSRCQGFARSFVPQPCPRRERARTEPRWSVRGRPDGRKRPDASPQARQPGPDMRESGAFRSHPHFG